MHKYYESRKIARERWRKTEHGKNWTQDYMREYRARPYVKAYNGVDMMTIMSTDKDIKRHVYDKVRRNNKTERKK